MVSKSALLTREQYLLLSAAGLELFTHKNVGLSAFDDFELAEMFVYEDDDRYSVINPGRQPDELLRVHVGTCPEDIEFDRLRPEQQHFFETYLPEVAARFNERRTFTLRIWQRERLGLARSRDSLRTSAGRRKGRSSTQW